MEGEMGGFLAESPRQERILWIASGGLIAQSILMRAPQWGQLKTSIEKTRAKRAAHG